MIVTNEQWESELTASLDGTAWSVEWCYVTHIVPACFATLCDRRTLRVTKIKLSLETFPTAAARRVELLRQLQKKGVGAGKSCSDWL